MGAFASDLFEKCVRLSFPEKVQSALKDVPDLIDFVPKKAEISFPQGESEIAKSLRQVLWEKGVDVKKWLDERVSEGKMAEHEKSELFFKCLLSEAAKSISHLTVLVNKHVGLLSEIASADGKTGQATLLGFLGECWAGSHQQMCVVSERLFSAHVVDHEAVIDWVFSEQFQQNLGLAFPWEIIRMVLEKLFNCAEMVRAENEKEQRSQVQDAGRLERIGVAHDATMREFLGAFHHVVRYCLDTAAACPVTENPQVNRTIVGHLLEFIRKYHQHVSSSIDPEMQQSLTQVNERIAALFA